MRKMKITGFYNIVWALAMKPSTRKMDLTGHYHIVGGLCSDDHDEKEGRLTVKSIGIQLQLRTQCVSCNIYHNKLDTVQEDCLRGREFCCEVLQPPMYNIQFVISKLCDDTSRLLWNLRDEALYCI